MVIQWSVLGRIYARASLDEDIEPKEIATRLTDQWADAVALAGFCSELSLGQISDLVAERAGEAIHDVSKLVLELNTLLGQSITQGWLSCVTARPGETYDDNVMNADYQEEAFGSGGKWRVIGTTALGLQRSEGGQETMLVKPRVAVERGKSRA